MKTQALYAGILVAALGFTACDEDYTDWAAPQSNAQQDPSAALQLEIAAASTDAIDRETCADTVDLVSIVGMAQAPAGSSAILSTLTVNGSYTVPCTMQKGVARVAVAQLDSVVRLAYHSLQRTERTLTLSATGTIVTPSGQALRAASNEVSATYLQVAPPATEQAYYILGDFCGWTAEAALPMQDLGNGVFQCEFSATKDSWFKILPQSGIVNGGVDWGAVLGSSVDGDTSTDTFVTWSGAQAFKVGEGDYRLTLDMVNWTYTLRTVSPELYLTGSAYNWGSTPEDWQPLVPVYDKKGEFWKIVYLTAGDEFKFAPQRGWGGDFGADQLTFVDHAGAALSGTGNVVVGQSGWYLLYVDAANKVLETFKPEVYLIGNTVGAWELKPENCLNVPEGKDGDFLSNPLSADGELRMCVHPKDDIDWWKMEFIILNGEIVYRGSGPDQERVNAGAGQVVSLNFTTGKGSVK